MDLDEWVWRKKITLKKIGEDTGLCHATLSHIKNKKIIPKLETALILLAYSDGEIAIEDLVPEKSRIKLQKIGAYNNSMGYKESRV